MQSYYSGILQRPVHERKDALDISKEAERPEKMLPSSEAEEIDIGKEERLPLNQEFKDIESLDGQHSQVEALDLHERLKEGNMNLSMFNFKFFFHPKKAEDEGLWNDFKSMALEPSSEAYEDVEGQICEGERVQDLQREEEREAMQQSQELFTISEA